MINIEKDGVYFCQECNTRLLLNADFIVWQDKENYTEPLCEECGNTEKDYSKVEQYYADITREEADNE